MTKREALRQTEQERALMSLGFTREEANQLRRISTTLRRWYELECGGSTRIGGSRHSAYFTWAIERENNGNGKPFLVRHIYAHDGKGGARTMREPIADRETGAVKRLKAIIDARNARVAGGTLSYYLQTDPRGAALYILRPGDVPEGKDVQAYYDRGICVY